MLGCFQSDTLAGASRSLRSRLLTVYRLETLATDRRNTVLLIRFLAALAVLVFHSYALTGRLGEEPFHQWLPKLPLSILGVDTFFFLSGLLVTKSWCDRRQLSSFLAARALRIYPALVVAVLFSIAVALAVTTVPARTFLTSPVTFEYLWQNATTWSDRHFLPGAFAGNPYPNAVNGSLWTLPIEVRLYLVLTIAGVAGLLTRRWLWLPVAALLSTVAVLEPTMVGLDANDKYTRPLLVIFAIGSVVWTWRAVVPVSLIGAAGAIALVVANPFGIVRETPLLQIALGYVVLVIAFHPGLRVPRLERVGDYSYGLYVFAFPIQQALLHVQRDLSPTALTLAALPLTLAIAALSWHWIERPALSLKPSLRRPCRLVESPRSVDSGP